MPARAPFIVAVEGARNGRAFIEDGSTQLSYVPNPNFFGSDSFRYTIRDEYGGIDTATVTVEVSAVNDAPTLDPIPNHIGIPINAGEQVVNLTGIGAGAVNEFNQRLTITAVSDNVSLIPNPIVTYRSPNPTGQLRFTPASNASGTATITVTITDDGGRGFGGENSLVSVFLVTILS